MLDEGSSKQELTSFDRINSLLINGDTDRIMQVCFENYLNTKIFDLTASSTSVEGSRFVQQAHFLNLYDQLSMRIGRDQKYELMAYLNYPILAFHKLFASPRKLMLQFPRSEFTAKTNKLTCENIVETIRMNMNSANKTASWNLRGKDCMVVEVLPFISRTISPDLKHSCVQNTKSQEFTDLIRVVEILASFGFKLIMIRNINGELVYKLDPYFIF